MQSSNLAQTVRTHVHNQHAEKIKKCQTLFSDAAVDVFTRIQYRFKNQKELPEAAYCRILSLDIWSFPEDISLPEILTDMGFLILSTKSSVYEGGQAFLVEIPELVEDSTPTPAQALYAEHVCTLKQIEADIAEKLQRTISKMQPFATEYAQLLCQCLKDGTFTCQYSSDHTFTINLDFAIPKQVCEMNYDDVKVFFSLVENMLSQNGISAENGFALKWNFLNNANTPVIIMSEEEPEDLHDTD